MTSYLDRESAELGRAIPELGDGMTVHIGSDAMAYTVIAVSPSGKTLTLQRDLVRRINREADTFALGGFAGHTGHPKGQQWACYPDPEGLKRKVTWRAKPGLYKVAGWRTNSPGGRCFPGRHEHYDYNF